MALALAAGGCSTGKEVFEQKLNDIKRDLSQVRASNLALQDRIDALEDSGKATEADALEAEAEQAGGRPNLEVVHLMPESPAGEMQSGEPDEEPASDEEPTVIRTNARGVAEIQDPNKKPRWRRR